MYIILVIYVIYLFMFYNIFNKWIRISFLIICIRVLVFKIGEVIIWNLLYICIEKC